jgi:isochorismate pyruvate lyase
VDTKIKPCECKSIEEIRGQIDRIDKALIELFAERFEYVTEIVKYKEKNQDAIVAIDRKNMVISQRAQWAEELGLDPETFSKIFRILVEHNITRELELIETK